jgi:DNA-3-methyladenine glycosylase II
MTHSASPEETLSKRDPVLGHVIASQPDRWPRRPNEYPIWGLVRIVMAQQISTQMACGIASRAKLAFPQMASPGCDTVPTLKDLQAFGLPKQRAESCLEILNRSQEILAKVEQGQPWELVLRGIRGVGPWTISTFRIMVLRHPDVLPLGDVGLERAVRSIYGDLSSVERLGENWRPFRSVASWYLWRTLGNVQLG